MASIRKLESGSYRAEVARQGSRRSKVFPTKTAAKEWAARQEHLILHADEVKGQGTLGEAMDRYSRERSPAKRGARWEIIRLAKLQKDPVAKVRMGDLNESHIADRRGKEVSPASVLREMQVISAVLTVCEKEWKLIRSNPVRGVRKPSKTPARSRLPTKDELDRIEAVAGNNLNAATARAFHAFKFAIETAMRAGEIVGMRWEHVDLEARVVHLPMTKNGPSRDVPLSSRAVEMIEALPRQDPVFGLSSQVLDELWRRVRDRAEVTGLRFHDSRHAAITRLAKKMDVLALAGC